MKNLLNGLLVLTTMSAAGMFMLEPLNGGDDRSNIVVEGPVTADDSGSDTLSPYVGPSCFTIGFDPVTQQPITACQ